ncbi:MAG: permease-like cell division protein FtsX [Desulfarculaceae bacterium]|nr:permease-like cell division protein FtsX [Desulfarculaceae bacterium]MCF8073512.1 permease-like cell division protein FtsX [Desulfarculaceae bacterium]MCF8100341.1 permease-like cell division protein FtsX [Desulfarculaceae bacterium]MCF8117544.1 permease-like cell division protein FtsX [Desulfarculaceae bacterium]
MSRVGRKALGRAWRQMGEDMWLQAVAVSTLTVALAIMGAYLTLCLNLGNAASRLLTGPTLLVVLSPSAGAERGQELALELSRLSGVASTRFVNKDQALVRFRRQLGPQAQLLDDLEVNPLPDGVELVLQPGAVAGPQLAARIKNLAGVAEVVSGRPWLKRLERALAAGGDLAVALGILLFLGVVLVASNTVRLAVHVRRRQLELMVLVGASSSYMRLPYLVEAVLQGIMAAALASGLLWTLFNLLAAPAALPLGLRLGEVLSFPGLLPVALAALAVLAGVLGGFLGVGRTLRPREMV